MKTRDILLIGLASVGAVLVSMLVLNAGNDIKRQPNLQQLLYVTPPDTEERVVEEAIIGVLGHRTSGNDLRMISVNKNYDNLGIRYVSDVTLGGEQQTKMLKEYLTILHKVSPIVGEDIQSISVQSYLPLIDRFEKETLGKMMTIGTKREVWEKIDWTVVTIDQLPEIVDSYWSHDILK